MKRIIVAILIILVLVSVLPGCSKQTKYERYEYSFFDTFDTIIKVIAYTETEEEFNAYMEKLHDRFMELHKLYDKYKNYEGVNNIKTINDNAGKKPVKVEKEIIDLLQFSKEWYCKAGEETNIALGPVIEVWSKYRDKAEADPEKAELPPMNLLEEKAQYTDIDKVIIDEENSTVFLEDENMRIDVGSVAKGYATELVAREIEEAGLKSAIISAGGNVRTIGKPLEKDRKKWGVGIQDPDSLIFDTGSNILDVAFVNDAAVVTSGDYQRYFVVEDKIYHHIIDPKTLMPGDYYRAVTIVTEDSGVADFLSTSVYLLPFEESLALVESLDGVEALWVMKDGEIEVTEGMKEILKSHGAKSN